MYTTRSLRILALSCIIAKQHVIPMQTLQMQALHETMNLDTKQKNATPQKQYVTTEQLPLVCACQISLLYCTMHNTTMLLIRNY